MDNRWGAVGRPWGLLYPYQSGSGAVAVAALASGEGHLIQTGVGTVLIACFAVADGIAFLPPGTSHVLYYVMTVDGRPTFFGQQPVRDGKRYTVTVDGGRVEYRHATRIRGQG